MVANGDLTVALYGQFRQSFVLPEPMWKAVKFVYCNCLMLGITRENVVDS